MDRVKAAIFSMLGDAVIGARVLDLFAGTGGLGIEALSRGATSAVFVEKDATAVEVIRRNLARTGLAGDVHRSDAERWVERTAPAGSFDLIFADPPYAKAPGEHDFGAALMRLPALERALAPGGIFILEKLPGAPVPESTWVIQRQRRYGATEVLLLQRPEQP
jgi:16S rRNA (guanine966-N2)-methyltransferase